MRFLPAILALLLGAAAPAAARQVSQEKVDAAIRKGVAYLKKAKSPGVSWAKIDDSDELILLTFIHAGVPENDSKFRALFKRVSQRKLERTYESALQAMIFEELDRVKYQPRILQCAQHLVDNLCINGQWPYGESTPYLPKVPPVKDVRTSGDGGLRTYGEAKQPRARGEKPKVVRKLSVRKRREGPSKGDNSNSQYAALGLRACFDAGVIPSSNVITRARTWWAKSLHPVDPGDRGRTATGTGAPPRGWCYSRTDVCAKVHRPYAAMTAGATGAVVIYDYMMNKKWESDPLVASGMSWLAVNFSVTEHKGPAEIGDGKKKTELYYYLYALERLGMLYDTERIGTHDWYAEGAQMLLGAQRSDGSWDDGDSRSTSTWDTCFAILFLKRATRRLDVATPGAERRK